MSMKNLARELARLDVFISPLHKEEQYITPSEIAAEVIWNCNMFDLIKNKRVVDLGAGTGVLGIACLLMGAKYVTFVEKDSSSVKVLEKNLKSISKIYEISAHTIISSDVFKPGLFNEKFDLVVMNPPFGTVDSGKDLAFLEFARGLSDFIVTFHKTSTEKKVLGEILKFGFKVVRSFKFKYPLKATMSHHTKKNVDIEVSAFLIQKNMCYPKTISLR